MLLVASAVALPLAGACDAGGDPPPPPAPSSSPAEPADTTVTTTDLAGPSTTPVPVRKLFDEKTMQREVRRLLTESYDIEGVEQVTCPPDQPVAAGTTFDCAARIAGEAKQVKITVKSEDGEYEVALPR